MKRGSEDFIQIFLVSFLKKLQLLRRDFTFWHCPNGEKRDKKDAGKLKLMGVLSGVPDLTIETFNRTIYAELKTKKGTLSDNQKSLHDDLVRFGKEVHTFYAETPEDIIDQFYPIMASIGYHQNELDDCKSSVLASVKRFVKS